MRKDDITRFKANLDAAKTRGRPDHIARIDALTRNARNTWFALLAALVFVTVTLAGVKHIDFYGVDRATQLPLVNVSVPTELFFLAAPVLTAAIYIYFHLYLIRLFGALGAAPARINGAPLSRVISPWLISDAALWLRHRARGDGSHPERPLEGLSAGFNILLTWAFGLIVLFYSWITALPARDYLMNAIGGAALFCALLAGMTSGARLYAAAQEDRDTKGSRIHDAGLAVLLTCFTAIAYLSYDFTNPDSQRLAGLDLTGEELVGKPDGWLPYQIVRRDFLDTWRRREGLERTLSNEDEQRFEAEWQERRTLALADLSRPGFDGTGADINLKDAFLARAFLSGLNLFGAQMEGADLSGAQMEGAVLGGTQMEGANLSGAQMEGADLDLSHLMGTAEETNVLSSANLTASTNYGGAVRFVDLRAIVFDAQTDFRNAFLDGSVLMSDAFARVQSDALQGEPWQVGIPCQWRATVLSDDEFYRRWRGWVENSGGRWYPPWVLAAPPGFEDVTPIPPPPGCEGKSGPMPGAADGG